MKQADVDKLIVKEERRLAVKAAKKEAGKGVAARVWKALIDNQNKKVKSGPPDYGRIYSYSHPISGQKKLDEPYGVDFSIGRHRKGEFRVDVCGYPVEQAATIFGEFGAIFAKQRQNLKLSVYFSVSNGGRMHRQKAFKNG